MKNTPNSAKLFVALVAACGLAVLVGSLLSWQSGDLLRFASFLVLSVLASRMKVSLPGVNGSMSVNLPFMLIAAFELNISQAVLIALASTLVQCMPREGKSMKPVQMLFNVCTMMNAVWLSAMAVDFASKYQSLSTKSLLLALAGVVFLLADTLPVAAIISLTENKSTIRIWNSIFTLTFPYFVLSAGLATMAATAVRYIGWQVPLALLPVMFLLFRSYKMYFSAPVVAAEAEASMSAAAD